MKKILILLGIALFTMPAFAVCSITGGACTVGSLINPPSLQDKYLPNNLQNLQKPDAFSPRYVTPYEDMLLNTDTPRVEQTNENPGYNSNCQFGVCLPGTNPSQGTIFD